MLAAMGLVENSSVILVAAMLVSPMMVCGVILNTNPILLLNYRHSLTKAV